ncbi:SGNH/GDSL hydrolase family protein [Verrucomicrobia bacterium S94]|nr:SGNH/GDSL hydrolase family protein [Verrucomicrobia bacterium S94]
MQRSIVFVLLLLACRSVPAETAESAWKNLVGEKMGRRTEFSYVENTPQLPNVLIYGGSVSIGYTTDVRNLLTGKANVYRIYCNGGDSGSFIPKMQKMESVMQNPELDDPWNFAWNVIHFNVGLHDLKYIKNGKLDRDNGTQVSSVNEYKKNLRAMIGYLQETAPDAKLIFATTTPVPEGADGRFSGDAVKYNAAAMEVLKEFPEVAVNDLYRFTTPHQTEWWRGPGNVHYGTEGRAAQAREVSRSIFRYL